ncbi:MAG: hypothetical protein GC160_26240 [Acidobacteria bacterium]|nr:hypothetical protein [Acidobacteriota bacterium]
MATASTRSSEEPSFHPDDPAQRRALIERVLQSHTLGRSTRLRELLAYLSAATFDDPSGLKEPAVGCAVYGRPAGYNTNDDNVVRMGVTQLRRKLAEYFEGEGRDEPLRVEIPKGNYALVFRTARPEAAEPEPAPSAPPAPPNSGSLRRLLAVAALLAVGFLLGSSRDWLTGDPLASGAARSQFWEGVAGGGATTWFVSEDIEFLAAATAAKRTPSLEAYANDRGRTLAAGGVAEGSPVPATTQLSLQIATRLISAQPDRFSQVRFVASRDMRIEGFKQGNVILVGSPRACPWLSLFEDRLNFQFEHDPVRRVSAFRNRRSLPGEAATYPAAPSNSVGGNVYSLVALASNLTHTGRVLILMGTRSEGTQAAAEAVTSPVILDSILQQVGSTDSGAIPDFEALLESKVMGSSTTPPKLIAVRRHESGEIDTLASSGF